MREIQLTKGKITLVDDEDYELLNSFSWNYDIKGYPAASINSKKIRMHSLIMNPEYKMQVDHKNGNKLDNRRENLRICTHSENKFNQSKNSKNKSGYKGVHMTKSKNWAAQISVNTKMFHLGTFFTKEDAALAYNKAAIKYHGEFAYLNIIKN